MDRQAAPALTENLLPEIENLVRGIIRGKLKVTLDPSDGRAANQDALEMVSHVMLEIVRRQKAGDAEALRDIRDYAAVTSYHACAEHLRTKYAGRFRLQYKLRYFLSHHPHFGIWESDGETVCGFAGWRGQRQPPADGARIASARSKPAEMGQGASPGKSADEMGPRDWIKPLEAVFEFLDGPVNFQILLSIVAPLVGAQGMEGGDELPEQRSTAPSPETQAAAIEILRALWQEVLELDLRWRRAFLLNPPREVELQVFPHNSIATVDEIGAAIALALEHYLMLWAELPLSDGDRRTATALPDDRQRFGFLWDWLPLRDALIGRVAACDAQQIINLRRLARERLAERLAPRLKTARAG